MSEFENNQWKSVLYLKKDCEKPDNISFITTIVFHAILTAVQQQR
jgi:hypothetical protein